MNREEAIKCIEKYLCRIIGTVSEQDFVKALDMAIEALTHDKHTETHDVRLDIVRQWIPVTERLPEVNGRYLCANDQWGAWRVDINMWVNGHWRNQIEKPIAWMPLPEPYSIESDGIGGGE